MADKKIDYSQYSQEQLAVARMLANPDVRMTNKEIATAVGITERTLYRYKENREFIDLVNDLADKYMDIYLSDVYRQLQKAVGRGSVKAIELALKRSGKLIDKREVSSDISVKVTPLEGKDNAELLAEIKELERKLSLSLPPGDIIDVEVGEGD